MPTEKKPTVAAQQYRKLVRQLGRDRGERRGWKADVARLLKVHPSYISKVIAGEIHEVGADVIKRAIDATDVDGTFFFDPPRSARADDANYKDHTRPALERERAEQHVERVKSQSKAENPTDRALKQWDELEKLAYDVLSSTEFVDVPNSRYVAPRASPTAAAKLVDAFLALPMIELAFRTIQRLESNDPEQIESREFFGDAVGLANEISSLARMLKIYEMAATGKAPTPESLDGLLGSIQAMRTGLLNIGKRSAEELGLVAKEPVKDPDPTGG